MNTNVDKALAELRMQFRDTNISVTEDGNGGAYFVIEKVDIGRYFVPSETWLGGHITAAFPFADIYPMYMDADLKRAGGKAFVAPVVPINGWQGRPAIQVSRINRAAASEPQSAAFKVLRVIDFLRKYE